MSCIVIPALLATACLVLSGCGSHTRVVQANETCGKQMTDLQDALASGAMTQHEYDKAHRAAMERCTRRDDRD
jgi:hypothetical protein